MDEPSELTEFQSRQHGFQQASILPLPIWLLCVAGAFCVLSSFAEWFGL
ncbi:hypothetical protein ABIA23_006891 [Sinorhizobium fredii]